MTEETSLYQAAGGMPFFEALVDRFYEGVAADPKIRPIYPEPDLAGARHRLTLFLAQYWGGPSTYDLPRGHPPPRLPHPPVATPPAPRGPAPRGAWRGHGRAAIASVAPQPEIAAGLEAYFGMAAEAMRNRD